jgi:hypothetical protein
MLLCARDKARVLRGIIRTLAAAADAGLRRPGESPLEADPHCDLCNARPPVGRLLASALGIGQAVRADGSSDFYGWPVEDPLDGLYWVCLPCYRLLRRLLEAHRAGGRN